MGDPPWPGARTPSEGQWAASCWWRTEDQRHPTRLGWVAQLTLQEIGKDSGAKFPLFLISSHHFLSPSFPKGNTRPFSLIEQCLRYDLATDDSGATSTDTPQSSPLSESVQAHRSFRRSTRTTCGTEYCEVLEGLEHA
ncbi:hypothetical protein PGT21_024827 [Puccinia graminis f. sp. tritici]|uniref:Uncharacterized protein n=1 Tax=Puccinia graminis f. sp. tritici TaxID=56615 RepID=A0A5B0QJB6_PUCGR|nr:hypothetical protein PGT21_024827 [Puccinia graminis f. sp. tritici]